MKRCLLSLAIFALSGCASVDLASPVYTEAASNTPTIEPGNSRLIIFRPAEGTALSRVDAYVDVSGKQSRSIVYGAFATLDVPSGKHVVSVKAFATSTCRVTFEVAPGEVAFFEIIPGSQLGAGWLMFGALGAIAGSAVEAAGKECGGEFAMRKVDAGYAGSKLSSTRRNPN